MAWYISPAQDPLTWTVVIVLNTLRVRRQVTLKG